MSEPQLQAWISCEESLPPDETPVLVWFSWRKEVRIGERRWDHPGYEDTYTSYWYWDDPADDGQCWENADITHWMPLPEAPQ